MTFDRAKRWLANVALVVALAVAFYTNRQNQELVDQGADTYAAVCNFQHDLEIRYKNGKEYLEMTPEERVKKYGSELGNIPESTIKNSLAAQKSTLDALDLNCG